MSSAGGLEPSEEDKDSAKIPFSTNHCGNRIGNENRLLQLLKKLNRVVKIFFGKLRLLTIICVQDPTMGSEGHCPG